jgi:hypothetical protein
VSDDAAGTHRLARPTRRRVVRHDPGLVLLVLLTFACGEKSTGIAQPQPATGAAKLQTGVETVPSPTGADAAEPFLFNTRGGIGLSWLEPLANTDRVAMKFAVYRNGQWTAPRTVIERNDLFMNWADFPSVVEDANGVLFAHWLQKSGTGTYAYDVQMATSRDGGATWSKPFLLNRDGRAREHGFVTLTPLREGGVGATWLDGRNMTAGEHGEEDSGDMSLRYANVDASGNITEDAQLDERTCECCTTGMTMTANGPVIVYRDRSSDEIRDVSYVRRAANGWTTPRPVRADGWKITGCPVNGPQIDASGNAVATAWFTAANEQQRVYAAFSNDAGETFGNAIAVDDGKPAGRVDVVMLDGRTALVTWLEQTAAGAEIRARKIPREGTPGPAAKVADASTARAAGFTRIVRAGDGAVWFTWTEHDGKSKKIHVSRGRF